MPDFSDFCNLSPKDFVLALKEIGAVALFCGDDFRFGKNAEGNTALLKELCDKEGIDLFLVNPVLVDGNRVSSTEIKRSIREGNIPLANRLLGDAYIIEGKVVSGKKLGSKSLYPTVNQKFFENDVVPKTGVYVSKVLYNKKPYPAVTNIGVCPTVSALEKAVCETYIIDEKLELYGEIIEVMPLFYLREEKKFGSLE
jgi:riboflavin kinase/FMN adenylyltransferase